MTARQSFVLLLLHKPKWFDTTEGDLYRQWSDIRTLNLGLQNQPYLYPKITRWGHGHCMHYLMVTACIILWLLHALSLVHCMQFAWSKGGSPYIIPKGACTSYVARKRYHVCLLMSNQHTVKVRGVSKVFFMLHWFQFLAWSFHNLDL